MPKELANLDRPTRLSEHAIAVLEKRFLLRDPQGQIAEDPAGLFRRVAHAIAAPDEKYADFDVEESEEVFFRLLASLRFLPNSPTLMNAGTPCGQLSGCFVLPVGDSMESIYGTLRDAALIQKSGGGTGFSFSHLRPRGDYIRSSRGSSSGPLSFIRLYDYSTQINRLGGTRAGANMAVLRHDHPDIHEFVNSKRDPDSLPSFNISVMVTDEFMRAAERGSDVPLRFPSQRADAGIRGTVNARSLLEEIVANAWETGDPGLLFYDRINAANPTPRLGTIEATNPCGEQPLLPYESCNLGSIQVARFVTGGTIDYDDLAQVVSEAVHFLDNVLDANCYPVEAVREVTLGNRKIGLGIMGFADLLVELGIPYASDAAVALAAELMGFIQSAANGASEKLARTRGPFPCFEESRIAANGHPPRRNACVTSIAPTGTISLLADCSSGIEPFFALSYRRELIGSTRAIDVHPSLVRMLTAEVRDPEPLLRYVRATGRLDLPSAPPQLRELFATAHEIAPEWHVKIQAAFQQHTETAVSKTINLLNSASPEDVAAAYRFAFDSGCKGVTVFRDGCKTRQVLGPAWIPSIARNAASRCSCKVAAAVAFLAAIACVQYNKRFMSFYSPSDSKFTRHYREEVNMVFSGLDCALHRGHVIYASSELTTGLRLYEELRKYNSKTADDLKAQLGKPWYQAHIWDPNVQSAIKFAEAIRATLRDDTIVITPAPFFAPEWSQPEYLAFWELLLRTRVKSVRFNVNWQFSNGCAFEFAVAEDAGLPTFDHKGSPLPRQAGIELIENAIERIESHGFDASKLRENLQRLLAMPAHLGEASLA